MRTINFCDRTEDGEHGFEMAPEDQVVFEGIDPGSVVWGCLGVKAYGTGPGAIGRGKWNTQSILDHCTAPEGAVLYAQIANNYSLNGYSDWFIPSLEELELMYNNKEDIRLDDTHFRTYITSTEHRNDDYTDYEDDDYTTVWVGSFHHTIKEFNPAGMMKEDPSYMRVIREF